MSVGVAAVGMAMASPAEGVAGFGDVAAQTYYTSAVQWMVDEDITTGVSATCFDPDGSVTRGQAAAFIWRMEGRPSAPAHVFGDVVASYQQGAVSWMAYNGITNGTTAVTFSPDDTLTRGQLAALVYRLAGSPAVTQSHAFGDVEKAWQQDAVSWLASSGITTGTTASTFSPDDTVSRAQLATFLYRYSGSPAVAVDSSSPACAPPTSAPPTSVPPVAPTAPAPTAPPTSPPTSPPTAPPTTQPTNTCHPAYSPCLPNLPGDALNCGDIDPRSKPVTVLVPGVDPYNIDRDGDGSGCES